MRWMRRDNTWAAGLCAAGAIAMLAITLSGCRASVAERRTIELIRDNADAVAAAAGANRTDDPNAPTPGWLADWLADDARAWAAVEAWAKGERLPADSPAAGANPTPPARR